MSRTYVIMAVLAVVFLERMLVITATSVSMTGTEYGTKTDTSIVLKPGSDVKPTKGRIPLQNILKEVDNDGSLCSVSTSAKAGT